MSRSRICALLALALCAQALAAQATNYHIVKRVVIGRVSADYIIIDPVGRRLYGLGDKVLDVDKDSIIGTMAGGGAKPPAGAGPAVPAAANSGAAPSAAPSVAPTVAPAAAPSAAASGG